MLYTVHITNNKDKPTNMHTIQNGVLNWINVTPTCFGGQATIVRGVSYATIAIFI
jgi:uncharacterized protein (DUF433 family)